MLISENMKIERSDPLNIALYERYYSKKHDTYLWRSSGHYWPTFKKAIVGIAKLFGPESIAFAGDVQDVTRQIGEASNTVTMLYEKILSELHSVSVGQKEKLIKRENEHS